MSLDSETISVHLRLKPSDYTESCYKIEDNVIIARVSEVINPTNPNKDISEKHFSFNSIMNSAVSQKEVYETTVGPAINEIFTERGATFLSYGSKNWRLIIINLQFLILKTTFYFQPVTAAKPTQF